MTESPIAKFWSCGKELQEESKFKAALNQLLKEFRKTLDASSPLAKSIDDRDCSEKIAVIARRENYEDLAEILFLDTEGGGQREAERRNISSRRSDERRKDKLSTEQDTRQTIRRSEIRRDLLTDRRGDKTP